MLKNTFIQLVQRYTADKNLAMQLWEELEQNYSAKNRHYHNLHHLEHLLSELSEVKPLVSDWDVLLFALFYHDIVYKSAAKDNEEKSAALADERMRLLNVPEERRKRSLMHILATKDHLEREDPDTNFLCDADLSMLGQDPASYSEYAASIRKEYSIYPDFLYKPGRKKILKHFLEMQPIYKTEHFRERYEQQARKNLQQELNS